MITNKTLLIGAATAALTLPSFAANSVTDGARAFAQGTADAGKGLVNAPRNLFKMGNDSLPALSVGVQEFGLNGNIDFADDIKYNLNLTYGYFFKENWQIGFSTSMQGENSDADFGLGLFTEYNFVRESKWVPFIGGSLGWKRLDSDAFNGDSVAVGLKFGVKYFINQNVALSFGLGAEYALDDVLPGGGDFNRVLEIGTRFYF